jgi:hypothetical protein
MFSVGFVRRNHLEDHLRWQSVSSELSVEDSHGKFVVEEEEEVGLKTWFVIRRFSNSETVLMPLPGDD